LAEQKVGTVDFGRRRTDWIAAGNWENKKERSLWPMANGKLNAKGTEKAFIWENNSAKLILFWNWNGIITKYCKMKAPERT
jgi:hypothetical protein